MSRQPSTSTLFPYTTLFRSQGAEVTDSLLDPLAIVHSNVGDIFLRCAYIIEGHRNAAARHGLDQVLFHFGNNDGQARDRKSTRLNSSHTVISYAVFCLKKKI